MSKTGYPRSIFFDLETSTTSPLGQILNFCFIVVDESFEVIETFYERVRISRTQLPEIGALLANKIRAMQHQQEAHLSEYDACKAIMRFFDTITRSVSGTSIPLIGYNSNKFDFDFLRTTLYRNGFIPPTRRLIFRDLLHLSRKIGLMNPSFAENTKKHSSDGSVSFRLEAVMKSLNLLKDAQTHDSKDDVLLTIRLAKELKEKFGYDIRDFSGFEPKTTTRFTPVMRTYIDTTIPDYLQKAPFCLLDNTDKYALWIDLNKWRAGEETRECVWYFHKDRDAFFIDSSIIPEISADELTALKKQFGGISFQNYFTKLTCDVEARISNIRPSEISDLQRVLERSAEKDILSKDVKALYVRWKLVNYAGNESKIFADLKKYASYRYRGTMQLHKSDEAKEKKFAPSATELIAQVREAMNSDDNETRLIAGELLQFYQESPMIKALSMDDSDSIKLDNVIG